MPIFDFIRKFRNFDRKKFAIDEAFYLCVRSWRNFEEFCAKFSIIIRRFKNYLGVRTINDHLYMNSSKIKYQ